MSETYEPSLIDRLLSGASPPGVAPKDIFVSIPSEKMKGRIFISYAMRRLLGEPESCAILTHPDGFLLGPVTKKTPPGCIYKFNAVGWSVHCHPLALKMQKRREDNTKTSRLYAREVDSDKQTAAFLFDDIEP